MCAYLLRFFFQLLHLKKGIFHSVLFLSLFSFLLSFSSVVYFFPADNVCRCQWMLNTICDCVLFMSYLNTRLLVMCRFHTGEVINYIIPLFFSSTLSSLCSIFYIDHLSWFLWFETNFRFHKAFILLYGEIISLCLFCQTDILSLFTLCHTKAAWLSFLWNTKYIFEKVPHHFFPYSYNEWGLELRV